MLILTHLSTRQGHCSHGVPLPLKPTGQVVYSYAPCRLGKEQAYFYFTQSKEKLPLLKGIDHG
jgi:hypothetical protein